MSAQVSHDLNAFVEALRDSTFFAQAGPGFALLTPGDWQGLRRWAQSHGFAFTLKELLAYLGEHPNVLGQLSKSPQLSGWKLESLKHAAQT
jgi:hypothetical protein